MFDRTRNYVEELCDINVFMALIRWEKKEAGRDFSGGNAMLAVEYFAMEDGSGYDGRDARCYRRLLRGGERCSWDIVVIHLCDLIHWFCLTAGIFV